MEAATEKQQGVFAEALWDVTAAQQSETARRDAWLAARRQHITSTDVAKILGLSKWGGATMVYLDKIGEAEKPEETERMRWGRRLEEAILLGFAERRAVALDLADPYVLIECPTAPILACSLDGRLTTDGAPVDAKNIRHVDTEVWGDEGTDHVPDDYSIQMAVQMACTGASTAHLAALFSGQELRCYAFSRDAETEQMVKSTATGFWDKYVVPRVFPPADGSDAYSEHLSKRMKQTSERLLDADPVAREWAEVLREARAKEKEIKKVKAEAEQNLKEAIGSALGLAGPGFQITWKKAKDGTETDTDAAIGALLDRLAAPTDVGGFGLDRAMVASVWATAQTAHTKPKPGSRRFLPKYETEDDE